MKKIWLVVLVLFFAFVYRGNSALAQEVQGPKMIVKEKTFDLMVIKEGDSVEHTFQVFNEGDQTLEIKSVKPG